MLSEPGENDVIALLAMTDRERMLAAVRGHAPDRVAWVPRLEFWYRARLRSGTLPAEFRSLSLMEITERMGTGHYAIIPDFTECDAETGLLDRALGLMQHPVLLWRTTLQGVDRKVSREGQQRVVEYHTPVGSIRTAAVMTGEMLDAGASVSWITEHAIREPRDIEVAGYIFSHLRVEPRMDGYLERCRSVGERGLVIGYVSGAACPLLHIMRELMSTEQFYYAMADYPERIEWLAARMEPYYARIREIAASSPAEVVLLGGNYDDSITPPPFFRKHILPALRDYAEILHRKGKYLMCHTDGENRRLLPLYLEAGFDAADSVCPYPMTRCRLEEIRDAFAGRIAIIGGIPSVLLCPSSASFDEFRCFVDGAIERYGRQSRFILGVSDMVTADADIGRLEYISEKIAVLDSVHS